MNKMRKILITIGIICAMSVSFTACEKDSGSSKLNSFSSKTGESSETSEKDKSIDLISKALQDGDIIFSFDGLTLLDGDEPTTQKDDGSSAGANNSSKADSGASNGGESNSGADSNSSGGNNSSNADSSSSGNSGEVVRPEYKDIQTLWFNSNLAGNISFDGEFLLFTFKIKDNAANGTYPITFTKTDIADYGSATEKSSLVDVKVIEGSVTVGGTAKKGETVSGSVFAMTASNESGNAGDQVTVVVDLKNNPGFAGVDIHLQYDSNVLEVVRTSSGKDFKTAIDNIE